jgi:hypothetical protein
VLGASGSNDPFAGNLNQSNVFPSLDASGVKFLLPSGVGGAPFNQGGVTPTFGDGNGPNPLQGGAGLPGAPDLTSIDQLVQLLKFGSNGPGNGGGHQTPQPNLLGGVLGQLENGGSSPLQNLAQVPNPLTPKHH